MSGEPPPLPATLGRYRVLRVLGEGGMGRVYLAEDPTLERRVAIKVVRRADETTRKRFEREARISATLSHPNVITVFDVGEDEREGTFLAMEYVDGQGLEALVESGELSLEAKLRVLVQAARGLEAAHAAGIVHRDVKPHNLLVANDGRVKLTDFGIARADEGRLTGTGQLLGTPSYIAPELLSTSQDVSAGTDRYAFAVMAFVLFFGRPPFEGSPASRLLFRIANDPPGFPEEVPEGLRKTFEKALAKKPEQRFSTLGDFLRALVDTADVDRSKHDRLLDAIRDQDASPGTATSEIQRPTLAPERPGTKPLALLLLVGLLAAGVAGIAAQWRYAEADAPEPEMVLIESTPEGAQIYLDDSRFGSTPRSAMIPHGTHEVRLEKPGFKTQATTLAAGQRRLTITLERNPTQSAAEPESPGLLDRLLSW